MQVIRALPVLLPYLSMILFPGYSHYCSRVACLLLFWFCQSIKNVFLCPFTAVERTPVFKGISEVKTIQTPAAIDLP